MEEKKEGKKEEKKDFSFIDCDRLREFHEGEEGNCENCQKLFCLARKEKQGNV